MDLDLFGDFDGQAPSASPAAAASKRPGPPAGSATKRPRPASSEKPARNPPPPPPDAASAAAAAALLGEDDVAPGRGVTITAPEDFTSGDNAAKNVRAFSAFPAGHDYEAAAERARLADAAPPARTYKFELDPFQKVAIKHIERTESVLVAAHTAAGKTVCAEYAIARCLARGQRIVYTSPIKVRSRREKNPHPTTQRR